MILSQGNEWEQITDSNKNRFLQIYCDVYQNEIYVGINDDGSYFQVKKRSCTPHSPWQSIYFNESISYQFNFYNLKIDQVTGIFFFFFSNFLLNKNKIKTKKKLVKNKKYKIIK